jgi:hypothetical protein
MVKLTPLLATPPTVTTTVPVVAPVGTVVTMVVEFQLVVVVVVPLNFTVPEDPKFVPVIFTAVPTAPDVGDRLVMFGAGDTATNKIVSEMDWELVPTAAVTVADWDAVTTAADAVKVAVEVPEATVKEAGTASEAALLFVNETDVPPEGDGWLRVTVHEEVAPEFTVVGEQAKLLSSIGACTDSVTEDELPFSAAVTVVVWGVLTVATVVANVLVDFPEATITEAGTDKALELLLARVTAAPPDGASWFSVTWQVDEAPDITDVGEHVNAVTWGPELWDRSALPGAGRFAEASSMTSTQSLPSGAVKLCEPLFGNGPMSVDAAVCGLYHQALAEDDSDVIADMLIVFAVAFPSDRYAMIVCPSLDRAATDSVEPERNPPVSTVCDASGAMSQCSRERISRPRYCCATEPGELSWLCHDGLVFPLWAALNDQIGPFPNSLPK